MTTERYFIIFWPEERCYSEVPESKLVEPKDPSVGQTVKVKEGSKTFSGTVEAVGNKSEIEKRLNELESEEAKEDKAAESGTTADTGLNNTVNKPDRGDEKENGRNGIRRRGRTTKQSKCIILKDMLIHDAQHISTYMCTHV